MLFKSQLNYFIRINYTIFFCVWQNIDGLHNSYFRECNVENWIEKWSNLRHYSSNFSRNNVFWNILFSVKIKFVFNIIVRCINQLWNNLLEKIRSRNVPIFFNIFTNSKKYRMTTKVHMIWKVDIWYDISVVFDV